MNGSHGCDEYLAIEEWPQLTSSSLLIAALGHAIHTVQTALTTELVAICSAWSAVDTQGPLARQAPRWRTHRGDSPPSIPTNREGNEAIRDLCTAAVYVQRAVRE